MHDEVYVQAKALPKEQRSRILSSFSETRLHKALKIVLERMEPTFSVAVTHGADEFGKDLVVVKKDKLMTEVVGVVVKKGDIKGTTAGDVDGLKNSVANITGAHKKRILEIESQIDQAFKHPAEMPQIFAKLPVNHVIVMLAGDISSNARKRLTSELQGSITVRDMDWMVDVFSEHYPQIFFEEEVITFLQRKFQQLESKHWLSTKNISLSEYFVDPIVGDLHTPTKLDEEALRSIISKRKLSFLKLRSLIKNGARIVIVGDPISGKSGAMAKLTIDMLKEASQQALRIETAKKDIPIPLLTTAQEIYHAPSKEDLLRTFVGAPTLHKRFKVSALLVDALDEVPFNSRQEVIEKSKQFAQELGSSLVITSRKIDIVRTPPEGFEKYELLPFEIGQALKLCTKLAKGGSQTIEVLKDGLERIKTQFPMVPLSLVFLIELIEQNKEIPASVTELYDRFFDITLGRWDNEKGLEVLFDYLVKKRFLSALAYKAFLKKDQLEVSRSDFDSFVIEYASQFSWDQSQTPLFLTELERAGILQVGDAVVFRHRSFLEFFAAQYLYENREDIGDLEDQLLELYFNDNWGEVTFFYIGLKREISHGFLERVLSYPDNSIAGRIYKFLGGRLLQAGWHSPSKVHAYGLEKALALAPNIRSEILKVVEKAPRPIPTIIADYIVMLLSKSSFGSGILFTHAQSLIGRLKNGDDPSRYYQIISLVWALRRLFMPPELAMLATDLSERITKATNLDINEKGTTLLLLTLISSEDKSAVKTLRGKLRHFRKKYPGLFGEILPVTREGYRKLPRRHKK